MIRKLVDGGDFVVGCSYKCMYHDRSGCRAGRKEDMPDNFHYYLCVWEAIRVGHEDRKFNYHFERVVAFNKAITIL